MSTLMPGMMPRDWSRWTKETPSAQLCPSVSSNMITPEHRASNPGAVNKSSRRACLLACVFSTPMEPSRLPIVPVLSSAARMPLPGAASARAVATSSAAWGDAKCDMGACFGGER